MDFVQLEKLPLPPSINEAYINRKFGNLGRGRVKSPKYRIFESQMFCWKLKMSQEICHATALIGNTGWLEVNAKFILPYTKLVTLKGLPKRHDVDNRLKVLNDTLGSVLSFDDCRIVRQKIEKIAVKDLQRGYVDVTISKTSLSVAELQ